MSVATLPLAEVTANAVRILCREIGPVNTARFLNQFTSGFGDYTEQRDQFVGEPTVEELVEEIEQRRKKAGKASTSSVRKRSRREK